MGLFSEYRDIARLLKKKQDIVVYAESRHYYQYFEKLMTDLLAAGDHTICYITSDKNDPLLNQAPPGVRVTYCKWMLGFLFRQIRAHVVIMTTPDLGNFFLKRSAAAEHYVYLFHAAVSTHQQYRKQAFDNYDIILCTGAYQEKEIRKAEELYHLPPKQLIPYGYPLLDRLEAGRAVKNEPEKPTILVAPSWFSGCIFETCLEELLQELSKLPFFIKVRSHPEYEKRYPSRFSEIKKMARSYPAMQMDVNINVLQSLSSSDILITDRSGIAFEFAFGAGKPVLFIDTALKETNPHWKDLGIEPVENSYRNMMGVAIDPTALKNLGEKIDELKRLSAGFGLKMLDEKSKLFYNNAENYQAAMSAIKKLATKD